MKGWWYGCNVNRWFVEDCLDYQKAPFKNFCDYCNGFLINWEIVKFIWLANLSLMHGLESQKWYEWSIWTWSSKPSKCAQTIFFKTILMTFICNIKIDVTVCKPHCVNFFFVFVNLLLSPAVWLFDIWHLFNILHLLDTLTYFWHFDTSLIT